MDIFFLTYRAINYMAEWFYPTPWNTDVKYHIVDNGQQEIPEKFQKYLLYQTTQNIGFAGGINLIAHIAFDKMNLEKIIIGQDDAKFTPMMVDNIWIRITPNNLVGAYDRSFEFALFGIHRDLYREIGDLDENFIFGGCEDNDYKHRIKLAGKQVEGLKYDANMNCSYTSRLVEESEKLKATGVYNATYIAMKWGRNYEYTTPFNLPDGEVPMQSGIKDVYGDITEYPSKTELRNYETLHG